jgi:hypothetical protein
MWTFLNGIFNLFQTWTFSNLNIFNFECFYLNIIKILKFSKIWNFFRFEFFKKRNKESKTTKRRPFMGRPNMSVAAGRGCFRLTWKSKALFGPFLGQCLKALPSGSARAQYGRVFSFCLLFFCKLCLICKSIQIQVLLNLKSV